MTVRRLAAATVLAMVVLAARPLLAADEPPRPAQEALRGEAPAAPAAAAPTAAGTPVADAAAPAPDAGSAPAADAPAAAVQTPVAPAAAVQAPVAPAAGGSAAAVTPTAGSAPAAAPAEPTAAREAPAAETAQAGAALDGRGDEHDQDAASTIELLDEDNRLEQAQDDPGTGDPAAGDTADQEDATDSEPEAAAALAPDAGSVPDVSAGGELFPSSPGIDKQKAFWIRIFTHYDSHQGVLHDGRIALPVYEDLDLTGMHYRVQRRYVRERKRQLAARLHELAQSVAAGETPSAEQHALLARLPAGSTPREIREFAANVRFQRGLTDRFRAGLVRSGALLEPMKRMLAKHNVPEDLVYLPHVESSFNNKTLSKFGAAGIWQFTRGTGRTFMQVGYEVDERLDPIRASEAAAQFLRQNYERLGTWPLAITAYNHGPQSLERITRRMGTRDLAVLIKNYDGRLFKFASKNFYAEFLAAREVAQNPEAYFGPVKLDETLRFKTVELPWHVESQDVADALEMDLDDLRELNPALRESVWSGAKYIPGGYRLRMPPSADPAALLAAIPEDARHDKQKRSLFVRVARGDTLYSIGRRHGIAWRAIASANNIDSSRHLRAGQKLILPWNGVTPPATALAADKDASADVQVAAAPLAAEKVVERIPVAPRGAAAPASPGSAPPAAGGQDLLADRFQELGVLNISAERKEGEIVAAYGETVGVYSTWAGVTPADLRGLNGMSARSVLRPGQTYLVPLDAVTAAQFEERRMAFHREREQSFFAEYDIREKVKIEVQRGQSPWNIAQANNVPMWLFYRENPQLLTEPLRVGMQVILPVVQAGGATAR